MTKPLAHEFDLLATVEQHRRSEKRWPKGHQLCNQPPIAPANVSITWDRLEQQRHPSTRGIVSWDEVTLDVDGFNTSISRYIINFQKSDDGTVADAHTRRFSVEAKDEDADTTAEKIIHHVHRHYFYRARVRAVDTNRKRGAWSAWTSWQHPNPANNAAPPTGVVATGAHKHVRLKWTPAQTQQDATTNIPHLSVSHYQVQIDKTSGFTSVEVDATHVVNDHYRYEVPPGTGNQTRYLRVRSVSHDGDVSAWQPSDSGLPADPTDDGVPIGHITKKHGAVATPPALTDGSYLWCNGAAVSRTTFPALFGVIGTTAGAGDGSTTFNLPDMRGKHAIGVTLSGTASTLGARHDAAGPDSTGTQIDHQHDDHSGHPPHGPHGGHKNHATHGHHGIHGTGNHVHGANSSGQITSGADSSFVANVTGGGAGVNNLSKQAHTHTLSGWSTAGETNNSHGPQHDKTFAIPGGTIQIGHDPHTEHAAGEHDFDLLNGLGHAGHGEHDVSPGRGHNRHAGAHAPWLAVHFCIRAI